jgi:hypothetical protein
LGVGLAVFAVFAAIGRGRCRARFAALGLL